MKLDKFFRSVALGAIFLVPFTPLIVVGSLFFPFIVGKNILFRVLVEVALGAWVVLVLRNKEYRPKFSWIMVSILTFVGVIFVADLLGANPLKSFWSNYERMEGWVTLLHSLGYFIVVTTMFNSEKLWRRFLHTTVFVSLYIALSGVIRLFEQQGGSRLDLSFGNASYLAVYMLVHIFIILFLWYSRRKERNRISFWDWFYGLTIFIEIIILYYTATRGAILGFVGATLLVSVLVAIFEKENKILKKISWSILIATLVLVGSFFLFKDSSFVKESHVLSRFSSISLQETTTKSRFMIWDMAWEGVKERPLFGWGQENFNYVFNKNYDPKMYGQEEWFDRTHNVFFDWLITGGFLGLLAYLSLFLSILYYLWIKNKNNDFSLIEKSIFTGLLAGYFVHNLFVFDNLTSYILFFTLLGFVHNRSCNLIEEKKVAKKSWLDKLVEENLIRILLPIVIILTLFSIYFFNGKAVLANRFLLQALSPHQEEGISKNLEYYKKALSYNSNFNQEIREQLMQFVAKIKDLDIDQKVKVELFELAVSEAKKEIEKDPEDTRTFVFLGSLLGTYSRIDEGLVYLQKGLELSPNKQSIRFGISSLYIDREQYQEAFNMLQETYELEPNYDQAKKLYVLSAIFADQEDLVEEAIGPIIDSGVSFDMNFVNAYSQKGNRIKAIQILEKLVENNLNNIQYRVSLAAAYFENNQNSEAIRVIEEAIEIDSNFKEQGEKFIEEINAG